MWLRYEVSGVKLKSYSEDHPIHRIVYELDHSSINALCQRAMKGEFTHLNERVVEELEMFEGLQAELIQCEMPESEKREVSQMLELAINLLRALPRA
jgi:hypothetical protein